MSRNLLTLADGRTGERIIQAFIMFVADDPKFREEFAAFLKLDPRKTCVMIIEEKKHGDIRADLELQFASRAPFLVELKVMADFSPAQEKAIRDGVIHAVIVPEVRLSEAMKYQNDLGEPVIRTWEDFQLGPGRSTPNALVLFQGLSEYVRGIEVLDRENLKNAMKLAREHLWAWDNEYGRCYRFLHRLRFEIRKKYPTLKFGQLRRSVKKGALGFIIQKGSSVNDFLWIGFVARATKNYYELFLNANGSVQQKLRLPSADPLDDYWSVQQVLPIPDAAPSVERISPRDDKRWFVKDILQVISPHCEKLPKLKDKQ